MTERIYTLVTMLKGCNPEVEVFDDNETANEALRRFYKAHEGTEYTAYVQHGVLNRTQAFPVSYVSKADLEEQGFNTGGVTPDVLERIADKMGDAYCDDSFWFELETIAKSMGIARE